MRSMRRGHLERFDKSALFRYDPEEDVTPSRALNIPLTHEVHYRQKTAAIIWGLADKLGCSELSRMTALVAMCRFFMRKPVSEYCKEVVASACVLLASKYEDHNRLLGDVARTQLRCQKRTCDEAAVKRVGDDIVRVECEIISKLGKDLNFTHPHFFILRLYRQTRPASRVTFSVAVMLASASVALSFFPVELDSFVVGLACLYLGSIQTNDQHVASMLPQWAGGVEYKAVGKRLHTILLNTPDYIKGYIRFNLGPPLFDRRNH